jgi:hypothetical protein
MTLEIQGQSINVTGNKEIGLHDEWGGLCSFWCKKGWAWQEYVTPRTVTQGAEAKKLLN